MATYEYARLYVTNGDDDLGIDVRVRVAVGVPADDGPVEGLEGVDALNRLGARGWRPLQVEPLPSRSQVAETWHLLRSSDDKVG